MFSNHDQPRHIDRYGKHGDAEARARAAALLLFTLPGTPFVYYGEELGMRNVKLRYRDLRDPYTKRFWPFRPGRDPARTPMQWDGSDHAGFTTGRPWLPVAAGYAELNVAGESADPRSLLALYKRLITLRRASPALTCGSVLLLPVEARDCLVYERIAQATEGKAQRMMIVVNFSGHHRELTLPESVPRGRLLLSTHSATADEKPFSRQMRLAPNEGRLVELLG